MRLGEVEQVQKEKSERFVELLLKLWPKKKSLFKHTPMCGWDLQVLVLHQIKLSFDFKIKSYISSQHKMENWQNRVRKHH